MTNWADGLGCYDQIKSCLPYDILLLRKKISHLSTLLERECFRIGFPIAVKIGKHAVFLVETNVVFKNVSFLREIKIPTRVVSKQFDTYEFEPHSGFMLIVTTSGCTCK